MLWRIVAICAIRLFVYLFVCVVGCCLFVCVFVLFSFVSFFPNQVTKSIYRLRNLKGSHSASLRAATGPTPSPIPPGSASLLPPAQKSKKTNAFSTFELKKARKPMLFQHFSSKKQENQCFFNISAQNLKSEM